MIKPNERQTTIRIDKELLRRAKYFLDRDDSTLNQFVTEHLQEYLAHHHAAAEETLAFPSRAARKRATIEAHV